MNHTHTLLSITKALLIKFFKYTRRTRTTRRRAKKTLSIFSAFCVDLFSCQQTMSSLNNNCVREIKMKTKVQALFDRKKEERKKNKIINLERLWNNEVKNNRNNNKEYVW